jgi:hypothetical protein
MSGHIGLREEARAGQWLARRIAGLFRQAQKTKQVCRQTCVAGEGITSVGAGYCPDAIRE